MEIKAAEISSVIKDIRHGQESDGHSKKEPVKSELSDRMWRTDNSDGLRPFKSIRKIILSQS